MWLYSQSFGYLWDDRGLQIARGYSGFDYAKNTAKYEAMANLGPIPRGLWVIGDPYNSTRVGPFSLPLAPSGHSALGRTDFVIHGDSIANPGTASRGCIILSREIRQRIFDSQDRILRVIE